jgi:myo-inositol-1(or 4)-monophosphatase
MMTESTMGAGTGPTEDELDELEALAAEFARIAGAEITASLGRIIAVRYKGSHATHVADPVSEVDHHVETLVRARIADSHPDHHIIGEEFGARTDVEHDMVWAIDPVDGTANFVNGLPLFSASIGVLHRGLPVVGALWCSTSHELRPGVFSARAGGPLRFEGVDIDRPRNPDVRRRLVGLSGKAGIGDPALDTRKTGSAAIELAFVATGLMAAARFQTPNIWDVAGGIPLVRAAGGAVVTRPEGEKWQDMTAFVPEHGLSNIALAEWRQPLAVGEPDAVAALTRDG